VLHDAAVVSNIVVSVEAWLLVDAYGHPFIHMMLGIQTPFFIEMIEIPFH